ncbi:asparagine synthase (glutamine-hydrolyzing) [Paludisphaera borealis]|uniref:asparagine synthase (glutamine-hydrolyzing) n=1 Tax=Paludisphaera borealis TaxID=1387353 RepID=A0A1U7CKG3_9BACT|nr:asparagine synthase (glutamine-hydrolyzing) [Paludisphaera borealis]APW59421.1 Asparagine synthetase [glutamine-hydrolyzing] 3 [Paludisphaera borealis]
MCGIAGAIDLTGQREFPARRLLAMTAAIAHRGPDDEQIHIEPGVALGARRLSIIDLAGGRQPLCNEDGSVWVAFNGELFEYPEIRRKLLDRGHQLTTRCDTEAWVHLYEDLGERMFEEARGQFAVSLWDRKTRTLILGRDRVGICPLYYAKADGWLLWGSEIKAILASGMVRAQADVRGIDHLFTFFCAGTTRTFFEGIDSIPPGHFLSINDGRIAKKLYWDLDFPDAGQERRLDDPTPLIEELQAHLETAVERRLRSDVPVVTYISGGLDSTVVLGLCSRLRREPIPAFTVGLDRAGPDERAHSTEAAEMLGSPLTTVVMDRSKIGETFPELVRAAEGPVLDTSCAALLRLAQAVHSQGYKVVLTGEGADEAFAGYVWYKSQKIRDGAYQRIGRTIPRLFRNLIARSVAGGRMVIPPEQAIGGVRPAQQDMYEMISQCKPILYSNAMKDRLDSHSPYADLDITNDRIQRWHPLNQSLYVGYKVMLAGLLMISKGDRIAMNASVESRYPYLDDDVIAFSAGIAPEYKLRGMTEKWILRQVAARILPSQIANRPKTMFRSNLAQTFLGPQRPAWADQLLSLDSLRATGYFDPESVQKQRRLQTLLPRMTPARFVFDVALTCVASTQLWHHIFCGGGLCDLPVWTPPVKASD